MPSHRHLCCPNRWEQRREKFHPLVLFVEQVRQARMCEVSQKLLVQTAAAPQSERHTALGVGNGVYKAAQRNSRFLAASAL